MAETIHVKLKIWRQKNGESEGRLADYELDVSPDASFLEMLDQLNNELAYKNQEPVAFEHDCREGICGTCNLMINGQPHGPDQGTTTCQLHMRRFQDGQTIVIEPFRAKAFPLIKDLIVDRGSFDEIMAAGGFITANVGGAPDANAIPVCKRDSDMAMDAASCIGCGACVAVCPNASAMLFVSAKVSQLALLPQGKPERDRRVLSMVRKMDEKGFGNCSNHYECEAACPKEISIENIARMNREYLRASIAGREGRD